ncbi:NAD(P)-dependent oxidoreductase [Brachybacterium sp. GCM10030267]|uniref:NAD(P)-dependent oxidoreductase n=1 Tax=unclassified Brachybacterium TaxID=2623841 RepID=UPI0036098F29
MSVVVVGLGAMGLPMAQNLALAGFDVTGVEPSPSKREAAREFPVVDTLADAPAAEAVLVMVATAEQLTDVVDDVAGTALSKSTWIIAATVGPDAARAEAERLRCAGVRVVDAPVTGGVAGARTGTLMIFVSGADEDVRRVRSVLCALGTPEPVGAQVGDGQVTKMVNQHLCTIHLAAAAEALSLAGRLGLDRARTLDLLGRGGAASWMLADRGPRMLSPASIANSTVDIFVKDARLVQETAARAGAPVPLLDSAGSRFTVAAERGLGSADDAQIITLYDGDGDHGVED